ncbi:hypothetical protein Q7C36_004876 [Tachysurus vachellii]|uniref:Uncharacterized protein n=1 Tax=Tachysurus vachellii TaxID=175792 RepID=A0AA88NP87_TACVA|nr:hypothetical protein Q7C36_004876 [Tachysurus vachellii]
MAWRVLPILLGCCLVFFTYGEENESHTELQIFDVKQFPVSSTGPRAIHQNEASAFGLEQKYQNRVIMLMNYRPRLRRHAEKKKKKHNAGAFSPLSMSQDGKKTHNSRTKRQESSKSTKTELIKQPLKHHKPHHEQTSPRGKVPQKKQVKKPQPAGTFSALSYISQDKERSHEQKEELDD